MKLLFFASLRETLGTGSENLAPPPGVATLGDLVALLRARGEPWATALGPDRRWRAAVNQNLAGPEQALTPTDEVAFFPPVTGG